MTGLPVGCSPTYDLSNQYGKKRKCGNCECGHSVAANVGVIEGRGVAESGWGQGVDKRSADDGQAKADKEYGVANVPKKNVRVK